MRCESSLIVAASRREARPRENSTNVRSLASVRLCSGVLDRTRRVQETFSGYAMSQLRRAEAYRGLEKPFNELWHASTQVAAVSFCRCLSRASGSISDDRIIQPTTAVPT